VIDVTNLLADKKNYKRLLHAGFDRRHLWLIKNGQRGVSGDTLIKIEQTLRLSRPVKDEFHPWSSYPNKLFYFMQVKKIDTSKLAEKTGLSPETIRKIIPGINLPSKSTIRQICRALFLEDRAVFPYYDDHIKQRQGIHRGN
jgi:DNA-binding Xre family transcriptional regulator